MNMFVKPFYKNMFGMYNSMYKNLDRYTTLYCDN